MLLPYQQDLFTSTAITHYRRSSAAPVMERPPMETVAAKLERIKGDPFATFGPPRSDRPSILTYRQRQTIVRGAANWLNVRQRVTLVDAPGSINPAFGIQRYLGRKGRHLAAVRVDLRRPLLRVLRRRRRRAYRENPHGRGS